MQPLRVAEAAALSGDAVLQHLASSPDGLSADEAPRRLAAFGPNAVRVHRASLALVVLRQLRSPLLGLLAVTATASFFVGQRNDALIIGVILTASVGLGVVNEFRAEKAAEDLHSAVRHRAVVLRGGAAVSVDVVDLVPGDVVLLQLGEVVPADLRLLEASDLECDESVLTGESMPADKAPAPVPVGSAMGDLTSCALMGSVVHSGSGTGVVVATGGSAEFGRIAMDLGERHPETGFQIGLRAFSMLLVQVAAALTLAIFVTNVLLHRGVMNALLFSLAIAVGISPQLLPAIVSTGLAVGSRQLALRKVLVKRLVCIEDLGDLDVMLTDKTGTLTEGRIRFMRSVPSGRAGALDPQLLGLLCNEASVSEDRAVGGNPLDVALWDSPAVAAHVSDAGRYRRLDLRPFDHTRRLVCVLVEDPEGRRTAVVKGAPESVLERCRDAPPELTAALEREFAAGNRVVAVASRGTDHASLDDEDEQDLSLDGLLVFLDPPKTDARSALDRLAELGITVKVVTGDNAVVAAKVCGDLGLPVAHVLTGTEIDAVGDAELDDLVRATSVFARVSPEHKARIVRSERRTGAAVGFLGDGVNDALALHAADVGISVDSATDVAKDAADVILLEKDLAVLADGVVEGRRVFANTIKYVLMGTSSNFGNMFSAAGASALLSFLPMLPSQILLNNLLYDTSQLAIPTDRVDAEQLARPSHWDVRFIRRFMLFFGPISSVFDFATFGVMLWVFHAKAHLFQAGWFVESLATQTLVIFAIRTRRTPFFRSAPSIPLLLAATGTVAVGALLPGTPLAHDLGFSPLPAGFFLALAAMVVLYLLLIETAKRWFFRVPVGPGVTRPRLRPDRVHRRAARFSAPRLGPAPARRPPRRSRPG